MHEFLFGNTTKTLITLALLVVFILIALWISNLYKTQTLVPDEIPESGRKVPSLPGEARIFYGDAARMPEPFPIDFDQRKWRFDSENGGFSFLAANGLETEMQLGSGDAFIATCDTGIPSRIGMDRFLVTLRLGERVLDTWEVSDYQRMHDTGFPVRVMHLDVSKTKQVLIIAGMQLMITAAKL